LDASTLARRAALLLPSQTRIVQGLVDRGLVTRARGEDRRKLHVAITDAGRDVIARNTAQAVQIAEGWRARLGPARYETLLTILEDLSDTPAHSAPPLQETSQ